MKDIFNLFFPKVCEACNSLLRDNEDTICTYCRHDLPVTNFHFNNADTVKKVLYGRVRLELATALFYFSKKGIVQQLIHNLKYRGHENIGTVLGKWLGNELAVCKAYETIDVVVPVPLHKKRLRKRGYNQVTRFGKEIAKALNVAYEDKVLQRVEPSQTQVFKNRLLRSSTTDSVFIVENIALLKHKHILLVDDIITTGATVEACSNVLQTIDGIKISLATMAIAE